DDTSNTGPDGAHTVVVRLTDAPSDDFESATVFVSQVALLPSASAGSEVMLNDTEQSFDLLDLQNGVTTVLASASVPGGTYAQIRVKVDSAQVVLKSPNTFSDGSATATLKIPSGSQSGLKINISPPVTVNEDMVLLVDFDASRSFVFQGPPDHPNSVLFKPVLHATVTDVAGSITGTVSPANSQAAVYAIVGTDTVQTTFANTTTGAFTLPFLPPATYIVAAKATGFQVALSAPVTVGNAESVTGINLILLPAP
ncbi:MAG TPA: DUF4382 domain-containing protein, partial [Gemmatimonadales bacterium]